jgi:hypothetical protein
MKDRIVFFTPHICIRGTSNAIYNYALNARNYHNLEPFIVYISNDRRNDASTIKRWSRELQILPASNLNECASVVDFLRPKYVYQITSEKSWINFERTRLLVHQTGMHPDPADRSEKVKYAYVSEWSALHNRSHVCENNNWVPHIIDMKPASHDFRRMFNIPDNATVIGRTGGIDTWNIRFVNSAVYNTLCKRSDIWFIFQNTRLPFSHSRVLTLPASSSERVKSCFISACDALLHARAEGESFGIVCGEFSSMNKRVITYANSPQAAHLHILGSKAIKYKSQDMLEDLLLSYKYKQGDWNCYKSCSPLAVAERFMDVFLN